MSGAAALDLSRGGAAIMITTNAITRVITTASAMRVLIASCFALDSLYSLSMLSNGAFFLLGS